MLDGLSWIDENLLDFGQGEWKKGIDIKDMVVDGVPVIIFRPDASTIQSPTPPVVIYFHGGGLALLSPQYKSYKIICIMIAKQTKSVVISVDYRLAPENVFPAQFDDGFAVVSAVMNKPTKFGIDANRIALVGDSAGGLLSAAISLEFAKITTPSKIAAQVLNRYTHGYNQLMWCAYLHTRLIQRVLHYLVEAWLVLDLQLLWEPLIWRLSI